MQFTFNEGHIQLPSQWQDQSMQVLVSTDNSGINLVITREPSTGTLTPELYQETLALYQGKLDGYTEHACREITLAEARGAWLLDYSWNGPEDEGNQGRISQISRIPAAWRYAADLHFQHLLIPEEQSKDDAAGGDKELHPVATGE